MMGPSQLADLLLSPLTTDYMPFMMGRMQAAMGYHRNTPECLAKLLKYKNGDRLLTPRLYTEDKFCCSLTVDYFPQLPVYHCRSLCFTSHESTADFSGDSQVMSGFRTSIFKTLCLVMFFSQVDWMVDLYPKGVWFQRCFKICTSGSMKEVPERVLRTVRASVSTKHEFDDKRVKIGVLCVGEQDGYSHIRHVRTANYIFSKVGMEKSNLKSDLI